MIAVLLQTVAPATQSTSPTWLVPLIGGGFAGSILTILYNWNKNRIQKMHCIYIDDEVIAKVPVIRGNVEHQNIYAKEFKLVNNTNKDILLFKIIFEFDAQSKIIKYDNHSKAGKNYHKPKITKPNECTITVRNFNRGDEINFKFDVANVGKDHYNVTEADCIGFKILVKDSRKEHQKAHGTIVKKDEIK